MRCTFGSAVLQYEADMTMRRYFGGDIPKTLAKYVAKTTNFESRRFCEMIKSWRYVILMKLFQNINDIMAVYICEFLCELLVVTFSYNQAKC